MLFVSEASSGATSGASVVAGWSEGKGEAFWPSASGCGCSLSTGVPLWTLGSGLGCGVDALGAGSSVGARGAGADLSVFAGLGATGTGLTTRGLLGWAVSGSVTTFGGGPFSSTGP